MFLNSCLIPELPNCMAWCYKRNIIQRLQVEINWCFLWFMNKQSAEHVNIVQLYMVVVEMLKEVTPNMVHHTILLPQNNHSIEFLIDHTTNLCINGVGCKIDGVI